MSEICQLTDINKMAMLGINLVDEALGANAHSYLPSILDFFDRLAKLKDAKPQFGPPTRLSIAEAKAAGEGSVVL